MKRSLLLFLVVFVGWTIYRYFANYSEFVDELLFKPMLYLLPTLLFIKIVDQKKFTSLGFQKNGNLCSIAWGIGFGLFLIAYNTFIQSLKSGLDLHFLISLLSISSLPLLLMSFATAISEEVLFRGYIFRHLLNDRVNVFASIAVSSFLFALMHLPRLLWSLNYSFNLIVMEMVLYLLLGVANCCVFLKTKNLTSSVAAHTLWNFVYALK